MITEKLKSIFSWLKENKTWLFSGIGVVVILFFLSILSGFFSNFHNYFSGKNEVSNHKESKDQVSKKAVIEKEEKKEQVSNNDALKILKEEKGIAEQLTPDKIINNINNTPVLQRGEKIKHYRGLKIKSQGKLIDILPYEKDKFIIILFLDNFTNSVSFKINLKDCPGIGLLKEDHLIKFEGEIDNIYHRRIELINAKIISF